MSNLYTAIFPAATLVCLMLAAQTGTPAAADDKLAGHWKLSDGARDASEHANHGKAKGVEFVPANLPQAPKVARFDGITDHITVDDADSLDVGTGDFAISAWIHTSEEMGDVVGDLVSKYDPQSRTGFHLGIVNNAGVPSSQANYRQLQFGIDNAVIDEEWTDHGRPGEAVLIFSMAVHDGELYVGTCEAGENAAGRVWRFAGGDKWIDCGSPADCNAVSALAVHDGQLYAGVSHYRLRGSSLPESENTTFGGRVFRYLGDGNWEDTGPLVEGELEAINGMAVYKGRLYASSMYSPGLYRYDGDDGWTSCSSPGGRRVEALAVYNGHLYATGYDEGAIYRYDGEHWQHLGRLGENSQTYSFAIYRGDLHVGTWPSGRVYRYGGEERWIDTGRLGEELEVMGMSIYNGQMYAGTLPLADVYRYDGDNSWNKVGRVDFTPDVRYRRAWTMAVHHGRLYVGTLPSGHVLSLEAGKCATYDRPLEPGWCHIAAVKQGGWLKLYVDGKEVAQSTEFDPSRFDLSNDSPLQLGHGPHDYLNGKLSDVRLYRRSLTPEEVGRLAERREQT